jgi:BlaI family penicillinase repressor
MGAMRDKKKKRSRLSRRESQIMEVIYRHGKVTVVEIADQLPGGIGTSSISKFLWLLEEKGLVRHERQGKRNIYIAAMPPEKASKGPLEQLMMTFFQGSTSMTVTALLNQNRDRLTEGEIDHLFELIKQFREENE